MLPPGDLRELPPPAYDPADPEELGHWLSLMLHSPRLGKRSIGIGGVPPGECAIVANVELTGPFDKRVFDEARYWEGQDVVLNPPADLYVTQEPRPGHVRYVKVRCSTGEAAVAFTSEDTPDECEGNAGWTGE